MLRASMFACAHESCHPPCRCLSPPGRLVAQEKQVRFTNLTHLSLHSPPHSHSVRGIACTTVESEREFESDKDRLVDFELETCGSTHLGAGV